MSYTRLPFFRYNNGTREGEPDGNERRPGDDEDDDGGGGEGGMRWTVSAVRGLSARRVVLVRAG
jgi:hypothetical protein